MKPLALLPYYTIFLEDVVSHFTSLVPTYRGPIALQASKQRFREVERSNANVISQLKTLLWLRIAQRDNGQTPFIGLQSLAYLALCPLLPQCFTLNPSSTWISRVSVTSELLQVQFLARPLLRISPPLNQRESHGNFDEGRALRKKWVMVGGNILCPEQILSDFCICVISLQKKLQKLYKTGCRFQTVNVRHAQSIRRSLSLIRDIVCPLGHLTVATWT